MDITKLVGIRKQDFAKEPVKSVINLIVIIFIIILAVIIMYNFFLK